MKVSRSHRASTEILYRQKKSFFRYDKTDILLGYPVAEKILQYQRANPIPVYRHRRKLIQHSVLNGLAFMEPFYAVVSPAPPPNSKPGTSSPQIDKRPWPPAKAQKSRRRPGRSR